MYLAVMWLVCGLAARQYEYLARTNFWQETNATTRIHELHANNRSYVVDAIHACMHASSVIE